MISQSPEEWIPEATDHSHESALQLNLHASHEEMNVNKIAAGRRFLRILTL
jgi:hypothetical protein